MRDEKYISYELNTKTIKESIEQLYNAYVGEGNLIVFVDSYSTPTTKRITEIGLNEGAKILANKLLDERMKKIPKIIKWLFKIK
jgi:hypothetical protein